jgi:hypothetical protein
MSQQKKYIPLGRWQEFIRERQKLSDRLDYKLLNHRDYEMDRDDIFKEYQTAIAELINKLSEER